MHTPCYGTGEVREYFERFGGVKDVEMIPDKATNRHKGFAFVTFEHEDAVKEVLSRTHELRGKRVSPRGHRLATCALVLTSTRSMRLSARLIHNVSTRLDYRTA